MTCIIDAIYKCWTNRTWCISKPKKEQANHERTATRIEELSVVLHISERQEVPMSRQHSHTDENDTNLIS